jgi:hypothetical protein
LVAVGYFAYLVWLGHASYGASVTEVALETVKKLEYPDVYTCLPASEVQKYQKVGTDCPRIMFMAGGNGQATTYDDGTQRCGNRPSFVKVGVSGIYGTATKDPATDPACPVRKVVGLPGNISIKTSAGGSPLQTTSDLCLNVDSPNGGGCFPNDSEDGCTDPEALDGTLGDDEATPDESGRLTTFTELLANVSATDGSVFFAACSAHLMNPGAGQEDSEGLTGPFFSTMDYIKSPTVGGPLDVNSDAYNPPYYQVYLTPRGTTPYHKAANGEYRINASLVLFSGPPDTQLAYLTKTDTIDKTGGGWSAETFFMGTGDEVVTTVYTSSLWSKPSANKARSAVGFTYAADAFTVRTVTIRNKTFSEVFAELGGLWAGSALLLAIFWANSGHLNKPAGREMVIFRFLPGIARKRLLTKVGGKDTSSVRYSTTSATERT